MSEINLSGAEGIKKIGELIKGIRFTMFTTLNEDGEHAFHSRPMATPQTDFDGTLWFLTRIDSAKIDEIKADQAVLLNYADPSNGKYVAVQGTASVHRDKQKIHELWNPIDKAWFPQGEDDPSIAVIKVNVSSAEYWEANASKIVRLGKMAVAAVTGGKTDVGNKGTITV